MLLPFAGLFRRSCGRRCHRHRRLGRVLHHGGRAGVFAGQVQAGKSIDPGAGGPLRCFAQDVEGQDRPHALSNSILVLPS